MTENMGETFVNMGYESLKNMLSSKTKKRLLVSTQWEKAAKTLNQ